MTDLELEHTNGTSPSDVVEIDLEELITGLSVGDTPVPTEDEAVAIASAISAHLTDRTRAAAAAAAQESTTDTVNEWSLAGRLDAVGASNGRRPQTVERGNEWKAAARTI